MLKIALIQTIPDWNFDVDACKTQAEGCVEPMVKEAAANGAKIVCLSEMWNCPYTVKSFSAFAEERGGRSCRFLSRLARENGIYLIGGTISEREEERLYNTCFVFSPDGEEKARHRKVHLFGIHVPGRKPFDERDAFTPGEGPTTFETEYGKIGLAVCFDLRFPELLVEESMQGADIIFAPSSFAIPTGNDHWRDLVRMRAIDTQTFFCGINNSYHEGMKYTAFGHSCVFDPWGECMAEGGKEDEIVYADIDLKRIDEVREILPIMKSREREAAEKRIG